MFDFAVATGRASPLVAFLTIHGKKIFFGTTASTSLGVFLYFGFWNVVTVIATTILYFGMVVFPIGYYAYDQHKLKKQAAKENKNGPCEITTKRMIDKGYQLCGTVDDVKRQLEALARCHGDGALEWISWNFFYQGTVPLDVQKKQLELFATQIWPEFR